MRVRAINTGFYNGLRIPGTDSEEFDVPAGSKASWFLPVKKAQQAKQDIENAPTDGADSQDNDPLV